VGSLKKIRLWISKQRPWWIFEHSILPRILSKISPIEIDSFSFGPFVFCKSNISMRTKQHEIIHYHQQIELLFVFQWLLYSFFTIKLLIERAGLKGAYYNNPFEREAYDNDRNILYLDERALWSWSAYIK
jgi:hypothetical protein